MNIATIETILLALLIADALALAALVLIQHGKGADVGAAFGSGSANTVFGSAGSTSFLTRATAWLSIGFFLIAFGLAYTAKERAAEVDDIGVPQVRNAAPQAPGGQGTDPAGDPAGDPPAGRAAGAETDGATSAGDERLTTQPDSVDSDIPDV